MARKRLKQAEIDALVASSDFDAFGTSSTEFVGVDEMSVVEQIVGRFIERVKDNIDGEKEMVTTGKISEIEMDTVGGTVNVYAYPHLLYIDRGVSGVKTKRNTPHSYKDKMPPVSAIKQWIKNKEIYFTQDNEEKRLYDPRLSDGEKNAPRKMGRVYSDDEKMDQMAWAVATKIFNEGIEARPIYSKEIPQLTNELEAALTNFTLQQINQVINVNPRDGGGNRIIIS